MEIPRPCSGNKEGNHVWTRESRPEQLLVMTCAHCKLVVEYELVAVKPFFDERLSPTKQPSGPKGRLH